MPNPSHLKAWQTADSLSLSDGDPVTAWKDSSGGYNYAFNGSGSFPTYEGSVVNGRPIVRFGASMVLAEPNTSPAMTFVAVLKPNDYIAGRYGQAIIGADSGGFSWSIAFNTGKQDFSIPFVAAIGTSTTSISTNDFSIVAMTYSSPSVAFFYNGASDGGGNSAVTFAVGQANLGMFGNNGNHIQSFSGDVAQIIQWDTVLSTDERCEVFRCLASEYDILIDASACESTPAPTDTITPGGPTLTPTPTSTKTPTPSNTPAIPPLYASAAYNGGLYIYHTDDGINFSVPQGVTNPVYTFPNEGGVGRSTDTEATDLFYFNSTFWVAYEIDDYSGTNVFSIASAPSIGGPWSWVADVACISGSGTHSCWDPRLILDDDGSVHASVTATTCDPLCGGSPQVIIVDAQDASLTSWGPPTVVDSAGMFAVILPPSRSPFGLYTMWLNTPALDLVYKTGTSLKSSYTQQRFGNWTGLNNGLIAASPVFVSRGGSSWTMYFDDNDFTGRFDVTHSETNFSLWAVPSSKVTISPAPPLIGFINNGILLDSELPTTTPSPADTRAPPSATPSPTTSVAVATATNSLPPSPTSTQSPPALSTSTATLSVTATLTANSAQPTATSSPTPSATRPSTCTGDCDSSDSVTVDELVTGVNIALGNQGVDACPAFDADKDGHVSVDELVQAVNNALNGCRRGHRS